MICLRSCPIVGSYGARDRANRGTARRRIVAFFDRHLKS
jgi:hypothetical protein